MQGGTTDTAGEYDYGEGAYGQRLDYAEKQWRDPIFAVLWIIHMLVMGYALASIWGGSSVDTGEASDIFLVIFVIAVCGAVFGVIWMQILRQCAGTIIKFMLLFYLGLMCVMTAVLFTTSVFAGVIWAIFTALFAWYIYSIWPLIPFTACLIDIACSIMQSYSGTIWVSILCLGLQIIWILWWCAIAAGYQSSENANTIVWFLLLVSFYWSLQVFQNCCHMTTCGVAGAWYFSSGYNGGLTMSALKRTLTTSFGSVCLGSLIVAVIQAMRAMVRAARQNADSFGGQCVLCILDCLLRQLDYLVQWFNKYAYVQCAVYGTSFKESASRTWDLLSSRGIEGWINDDLTGFALACGALVGAIVCGLIGYFIATLNDNLDDGSTPYIIGIIGLFIGYFLVHTVLYTIESGVTTLFVCYAEDPDAMQKNRNEEYTALMAVAPRMQEV